MNAYRTYTNANVSTASAPRIMMTLFETALRNGAYVAVGDVNGDGFADMRFAVTAMIDLALRSNNGPVALAAISQRQQISLSYLEQLFGKLRRHELVESTRGPGGGYSLGRSAAEITVADDHVAADGLFERSQRLLDQEILAAPLE